MNEHAIYPWQSNLLKHLHGMRGHLPHALLLQGRSGIGKFDFSMQFSQSLLCLSPKSDGNACGICQSCNWFQIKHHPDFRLLAPEQNAPGEDEIATASNKKIIQKNHISIAQIRELENFFTLSSHHGGGRRIVLIFPAEGLNAASANALLKVLEEPPPDVVFILVAHQAQRLLATIISRCQKIEMPVPAPALAIEWLQQEKGLKDAEFLLSYAGGAPLTAFNRSAENDQILSVILSMLAQGAKLDPVKTAQKCLSQGVDVAINTLQKWIYDLTNYRLLGEVRYNIRHISALQALGASVNLSRLFNFSQKLNEAQKTVAHPLNHELQLEGLLLQYTQIFSMHIPS